MPIRKHIELTEEEREDVRFVMTISGIPSDPQAEGYETAEEYCERVGADDNALASYRAQRYAANREQMVPLADELLGKGASAFTIKQLFSAGVPTLEILDVVTKYVLASPEKKTQVRGLLSS